MNFVGWKSTCSRLIFCYIFKFWRGTPRGEAGTRLQANELFVHIRNIILHQISAKFSVFFRSIAKEKVSALPKRKLRGKRWIKWGFCEKDFDLWAFLQNQPCISVYWPKVDVRTKLAGSHINSQFIYHTI